MMRCCRRRLRRRASANREPHTARSATRATACRWGSVSTSAQISYVHTVGHGLRQVREAREGAHMPARLHDEIALTYLHVMMSRVRGFRRRHVVIEVLSQSLAQIRHGGAVPRDRKHLAVGSCEL